MKKLILILLFLIAGKTFAETNIYKFSGACVTAGTESYSKTLTADEVLNLQDSTQLPLPEFYFSNHGEYGVTNWSAFPSSSRQVGSEFKLQVSRQIDDVLYLSKWDFRYSFFLGMDRITDKPMFAASGENLTGGEQCLSIGKNRIISTSRDSNNTVWIVIRIDEI
jgi:hypothetical protein